MALITRLIQMPSRLRYLLPVVAVGICTFIRAALDPWLGDQAPFTIFFFGILFSAFAGGLWAGLLATLLSLLSSHYFFSQPRQVWFVLDYPHQPLSLLLYALVGVFTSILCDILRRSEARFRTVVEAMPLLIWQCDRNGRCDYFNARWLGFTGRSFEQESGEGWLEGVHPEDRQRVSETFAHAFARREAFTMEYRLRHHSGEYRWILDPGVPRFDLNGRFLGYVGGCVDITPRKQIEAEMQRILAQAEEAQRTLHAIMEHIPMGIMIADAPNVAIRHISRFGRELTGRAREQVEGIPFALHSDRWDVYCADGVTPAASEELPLTRATLHGEVVQDEVWSLGRADGQRIPILCAAGPIRDRDGRIVGGVVGWHDITQRRQTEEALRRSEAWLHLALAAARAGAWDFDFATGRIAWSPENYELHGLDPKNGPPDYERWERCLHPDDLDRTQRIIQDVAAGRISDYRAEFRVVHPIHGPFWMLAIGRVERAADGTAIRMSGLNIDISQMKQTEAALADAKRIAEQAQAIAEEATRAKDHFLAVLSHELRTPLTPVVAALSLLQNRWPDELEGRELLGVMRRNVEMEARLIDDLLDVTRIARGKIELDKRPVDLREVIRRALEVCQPDLETRQIHLSTQIPDSPQMINADATRLQQVFWNLLRNAAKFTPRGGRIEIRVSAEPASDSAPGTPHSALKDAQHSALIEVVDSGDGIDPSILPHIFQPFEQGGAQTTRRFGGLGLGLTISKGLIEMHGGTISAHSDGKGKGAKFAVRLPLAEQGSQHSVVSSQHASSSSADYRLLTTDYSAKSPLRILLVEDHGDTARIMQKLLRCEGHEVRIAADVASALELSARESFDLIISDLGLPDGSGLDLMRELRRRGCLCPGIALSGYGMEDDHRRSREAGFATHLTKPTSLDRLQQAIAAL